jgi:hypothetical protein
VVSNIDGDKEKSAASLATSAANQSQQEMKSTVAEDAGEEGGARLDYQSTSKTPSEKYGSTASLEKPFESDEISPRELLEDTQPGDDVKIIQPKSPQSPKSLGSPQSPKSAKQAKQRTSVTSPVPVVQSDYVPATDVGTPAGLGARIKLKDSNSPQSAKSPKKHAKKHDVVNSPVPVVESNYVSATDVGTPAGLGAKIKLNDEKANQNAGKSREASASPSDVEDAASSAADTTDEDGGDDASSTDGDSFDGASTISLEQSPESKQATSGQAESKPQSALYSMSPPPSNLKTGSTAPPMSRAKFDETSAKQVLGEVKKQQDTTATATATGTRKSAAATAGQVKKKNRPVIGPVMKQLLTEASRVQSQMDKFQEKHHTEPPERVPFVPYVYNSLKPYFDTSLLKMEVTRCKKGRRIYVLPFLTAQDSNRRVMNVSQMVTIKNKSSPYLNLSYIRPQLPQRFLESRCTPRYVSVHASAGRPSPFEGAQSTSYARFTQVRKWVKHERKRQCEEIDASEYERTCRDFYHYELDRLDLMRPPMRKRARLTYAAYLSNTRGARDALRDCLQDVDHKLREMGLDEEYEKQKRLKLEHAESNASLERERDSRLVAAFEPQSPQKSTVSFSPSPASLRLLSSPPAGKESRGPASGRSTYLPPAVKQPSERPPPSKTPRAESGPQYAKTPVPPAKSARGSTRKKNRKTATTKGDTKKKTAPDKEVKGDDNKMIQEPAQKLNFREDKQKPKDSVFPLITKEKESDKKVEPNKPAPLSPQELNELPSLLSMISSKRSSASATRDSKFPSVTSASKSPTPEQPPALVIPTPATEESLTATAPTAANNIRHCRHFLRSQANIQLQNEFQQQLAANHNNPQRHLEAS